MNFVPAEVIASSVPFRFLVGPNEREFTIHSALFAYQSPVLEKLANGSFSEAAEKCVKWKAVEEDTFIRFWQYTYTGKYTAAPPVIGLRSESDASQEPPPPSPPTSGFLFGGAPKEETPHKEPTKRELQWRDFKRQRASAGFGPFRSAGLFGGGVRRNLSHEDYTNHFLSHAELYVFAECYAITGLMELCLNELHATLVGFWLSGERINDIVALVRYCYENVVPEPLRDVVARYAACKIDKLWLSDQFQALVETHGELSRALIGSMLNVL
ncbi:hypothetical protein V8C42DRAFT_36531 [Trichoderma barbatum]